MTNLLKKFFLLLSGVIFVSCSLEEDYVKNNQSKLSIQDLKIEHITYNDFIRKTQFIKNKPNFSNMISENLNARTIADSSDYIIYTDNITEITNDDYTSYTMLLKTPDTTKNLYYNIVFEVRNENITVFIIKYTKSENGILEETITTFRYGSGNGGSNTNELQLYIEDFEEILNDDLTDTASGLGSGGGGSTNWTGLGGSPIYPHNCNGIVTTTYVLEPKYCASSTHLPGQQCDFLDPEKPYYDPSKGPYYDLVPYYTCDPNQNGDFDNPPNDGGGNTGGGSSNTPEDDDSITGMIQPEECDGNLQGDLNGDCMLSQYEMCLLNGYSEVICDCVNQGGNILDCEQNNPCEKIISQKNNSNFQYYENLVNNNTAFNLSEETGYSQNSDGSFYQLPVGNGGHSLGMPITNNMIGYIHCHINSYEVPDTNDDGIPDLVMPVKMPSPEDIVTFLKLLYNANNHGIPLIDIYGSMYSSSNDYTLKFTGDINDVLTNLNNLRTLLNTDKLDEKYKTYFKDYGNREKAFLKFLKNEIGIDGIRLFKINGSTVKEKYLNEKGKVDSKDC